MLALSLTLCGWQAKLKLPNPQQPLVNQNLVMKQMQSQQSAHESLSRSGCFSKYIKQNQRWHMMAYCSMAGLFISAIAVLPQAVSFWTCLCVTFHRFKDSVDLPVVAHLQHGRKSGAGVLGACLDATEIEN